MIPRTRLFPTLLLLVLFLAALAAVAEAPPPGQELLGDWVGWAYLDEGGDLPLRLRITRDRVGLDVRFDELVSRGYDLPAELTWNPPRLVVRRTRPDGSRIVLEAEVEGAAMHGRLDWSGHVGDAELSLSPLAIARVPPERFADLTGTYRLAPERSLVVTARFWGELVVTDLATGRYATLFPADRDAFFVGGALYVPAPIHAHLRFLRDDEGEAVAVEWREDDGGVLSGSRVSFREEEVEVESDGVRLAGTLVRPDRPGPLPAAVVVPGSNWTDREAGRRDAEILASFGMATLIYDKRGHGASGGEATVAFRQTARDAAAAVAFLAGRSDVRGDQVGLVGRSRGGWIAPLAATLAPDAAFLVLFVPPAVSPAAQETTRRLNLLEDEEAGAEELALAREMLEAAWRFAASGEGWDAYAEARERAAAAGLPDEIFEPAAPDDPEWRWTRLNMAYDPLPALESLSMPVLALFGEGDRNVVVADNLPAMRAALERGGHRDFELFVVPGADHGLRVVDEERDLPPHRRVGFGSSGWPRVARWLGQRLDLAAPGL